MPKPLNKKVQPERSEAVTLIGQILAFVREHRLKPQDRLPSERLLVERFGTTRPVIREALAVLDCLRIVERRPRSGVYLRAEASAASLDMIVVKADLGLPVDDDEVEQLSEFRTLLEAQAIVLACRRHTPRDIERMDECNRQCRERLKRKESIAQPSAEFHLAVIAATQNQFLLRTANSFYLATRAWREQVFDDVEVCRRSIRDHEALRNAIALGQDSQALDLMVKHLQVADHYWHDWHASVSTPRGTSGPA
jgi:DNA-binding FadR family transcriptional regulator